MPPGYRKRRSQSRSSDEESDEKRSRKQVIADVQSMSHDHCSPVGHPFEMRKRKSTVLVLDCKKLQNDVMLLMYCTESEGWLTLPLEYSISEVEEPWKYLTARNLIGFVRSAIIYWKDEYTLISASFSRSRIQCFPSMGAGRSYSSSKWRYICALNQLFAVNIYNTGHTDGNLEVATVNVMSYSFKDEGWEKLAEYEIKKMIKSNPLVLGIEGTDGLWLCIADYYMDTQTLKVEKHDLHILYMENYTWALEALDCSDLSEVYGRNQHFPSLSTNVRGDLCLYIEPVVYTYSTSTSDWSEADLAENNLTMATVLAETKMVTGLRKFYFKVDATDDTCEFFSQDLETGESVEHDVPPISIFQKAPHMGSLIQRQKFRISNSIGDSKVTCYRVSDKLLEKAKDTTFEQFECEF